MENAPYLPARSRVESLSPFPLSDSHQSAEALETAPAAFDAGSWLAAFEQVGGGYIVTDRLSLAILVENRSDEEIVRARRMIVELTEADRAALIAHLRGRA